MLFHVFFQGDVCWSLSEGQTTFFSVLSCQKKKASSLGGLEPPTFRLTAERANRLRHRDLDVKLLLGQAFFLVAGLTKKKNNKKEEKIKTHVPSSVIPITFQPFVVFSVYFSLNLD